MNYIGFINHVNQLQNKKHYILDVFDLKSTISISIYKYRLRKLIEYIFKFNNVKSSLITMSKSGFIFSIPDLDSKIMFIIKHKVITISHLSYNGSHTVCFHISPGYFQSWNISKISNSQSTVINFEKVKSILWGSLFHSNLEKIFKYILNQFTLFNYLIEYINKNKTQFKKEEINYLPQDIKKFIY